MPDISSELYTSEAKESRDRVQEEKKMEDRPVTELVKLIQAAEEKGKDHESSK